MINKMAVRVLTYELGSPSYGDLKLESGRTSRRRSSSYLQAKQVFRMNGE